MKKILKYTVIIVLLLIAVLGIRSCMNFITYDDRTTYFTSPDEKTVLTLKYDYVSRPFLFYNDELIFEYSRNGFAETIFFEIEWLSERKIRLFCEQFDEEFFITLQ